jgi:hypothetical protein
VHHVPRGLSGGERETDAPCCASPVIGAFAILVNDQMPGDVRQRLKPFAPCIVGTKDGLDGARAEILRRALVEEILPRMSRSQTSAAAPGTAAGRTACRRVLFMSSGHCARNQGITNRFYKHAP